MSFVHSLWFSVQCFYEILECVNKWVSVLCLFLSSFFFCLFALSKSDEFIKIVTFYYNISYNNIYYYPLEASFFFFLLRDRGMFGWEE